MRIQPKASNALLHLIHNPILLDTSALVLAAFFDVGALNAIRRHNLDGEISGPINMTAFHKTQPRSPHKGKIGFGPIPIVESQRDARPIDFAEFLCLHEET
jgi:hypothetical protein